MILPMRECVKQWNTFVDAHAGAWFYHRTDWLDFQALQPGYTQRSFAIIEDDKILLLCPLLKHEASGDFIMPDGPCPVPLAATDNWNHLSAVREMLAGEGRRWILRTEGTDQYLFATNFPYSTVESIGWRTRVLNLTQNEDKLHSALRKSYQSLINRGIERMEFEEGPMMVDEMQGLRQEAGRPYSRVAHELMRRWVEQGNAFCVAAFIRGETPCRRYLGANYFLVYKGSAYYMSGVHAEDNVAHALQWRSIQHMRRVLRLKHYEIGWQGHAENEKEANIEFFKSGWGGHDVPLPVWRITL